MSHKCVEYRIPTHIIFKTMFFKDLGYSNDVDGYADFVYLMCYELSV
jgi:hypothetical protein